MAIRTTHAAEDIQLCVFKLLDTLASSTAPWTSWDVIPGYPEKDVQEHFEKPFIYVESPRFVGTLDHQGGLPVKLWEMNIGAWTDSKTGRTGELNIMSSYLLDLFTNPQEVHKNKTFTVQLGTTTYTDTNLLAQEIQISDVQSQKDYFVNELKEFREELLLLLQT